MTILDELKARMSAAEGRYGAFASTHEAMGVALEEWDELRQVFRENDFQGMWDECLDLASVCLRLAEQIDSNPELRARSIK